MIYSTKVIRLLGAFIIIFIVGISCKTTRNYTYFRDIPDSSSKGYPQIVLSEFKDPLIHNNDILQISILTLDPAENTVLSAQNASTYSTPSGTGEGVQGFLVDKDGMIELPVIGKMHVAGLTTSVARDSIHNRVEMYYKNPVVNVRFLNFSVTVLGEVTHPGIYTAPNEKVSILDAIGMAGDLTIYGKRENVLLVRDSSGIKKFARFDLGSTKILQSPYYYLQQGDVLYVEPNKSKIASTDAVKTRNYALVASLITVFVVIITRL